MGDSRLTVLQVIDSSFNEEVIRSNRPVLVDFWAPWCGPCRMIAPVVDEIADEYAGTVKVVKINTDENPSASTEYGIRSIPTLMIFIDGKIVDTVIGAVPKSTLASTLQKQLRKHKKHVENQDKL
uniref:thioredoxin n=1 Tax=Anunuuluaehu liula TaxID=3049639 RepID=UPI0030038BF4